MLIRLVPSSRSLATALNWTTPFLKDSLTTALTDGWSQVKSYYVLLIERWNLNDTASEAVHRPATVSVGFAVTAVANKEFKEERRLY